MISGLIVYSKIDREKNDWFIKSMIKSLNERGVSLLYLDEDDLLEYVNNNKVDFVLYRSRNYQLLAATVATLFSPPRITIEAIITSATPVTGAGILNAELMFPAIEFT